jgi:hypothetical protein
MKIMNKILRNLLIVNGAAIIGGIASIFLSTAIMQPCLNLLDKPDKSMAYDSCTQDITSQNPIPVLSTALLMFGSGGLFLIGNGILLVMYIKSKKQIPVVANTSTADTSNNLRDEIQNNIDSLTELDDTDNPTT